MSNRLATANNHLLEDYDDKKPSSYIVYLDANNLYGECTNIILKKSCVNELN